jgi:hypothetical protein
MLCTQRHILRDRRPSRTGILLFCRYVNGYPLALQLFLNFDVRNSIKLKSTESKPTRQERYGAMGEVLLSADKVTHIIADEKVGFQFNNADNHLGFYAFFNLWSPEKIDNC